MHLFHAGHLQEVGVTPDHLERVAHTVVPSILAAGLAGGHSHPHLSITVGCPKLNPGLLNSGQLLHPIAPPAFPRELNVAP